ncbi:MAG: hypothetical protein M0D57_09770 [Sphingobacteriales bacterium JAD_PAG50586_3]|nr:MAG: hypothetical protein M0D57_09770 [Sphingobacteriales bacterium JAD_PAG50586_3]
MKYFPAETITYKTKLSKDEVLERIKKEITPKYLHQTHTDRFKGTIAGNTFLLKQVNTSATSVLPTIWGSVSENGAESTVTLNITLTQFIQAFAGLFVGLMALQCLIAIVLIRDLKGVGLVLSMLIFYAFFIFVLHKLIGFAFKKETDKIYTDFYIMLDAKSFEKSK